jgi:hypothetical protein
MYVDVTENYYTLEDDVKFFLYFISQRSGVFVFSFQFSVKYVNASSFLDISISKLNTRNPKLSASYTPFEGVYFFVQNSTYQRWLKI